jgi:hypothetical protein
MAPTRDGGIMHAYALQVAGVYVRLLAYGVMPHEVSVTLGKLEMSKEGAGGYRGAVWVDVGCL